MRHAFSILSIVALAGVATLLPLQAICGQTANEPGVAPNGVETVPVGRASGEVLLDSAITAMDSHESLSARTRLQVHLMGHHLFGPGTYLQKGSGADRKIRFSMTVQGRTGKRSLTQVNDSRRLWLLEDAAAGKQLRFVDLQRLREAGTIAADESSSLRLNSMGLGGLPGLMNSLQSSFQFGPAVRIQWNGMTVWAMRGAWRPHQLTRLVSAKSDGEQTDASDLVEKLPEWAPTEVGILLDIQTLFPYRFEFLRSSKRGLSRKQSLSPIATMELFELRFDEAISENQFDRPSQIKPVDITKTILRSEANDQTSAAKKSTGRRRKLWVPEPRGERIAPPDEPIRPLEVRPPPESRDGQ